MMFCFNHDIFSQQKTSVTHVGDQISIIALLIYQHIKLHMTHPAQSVGIKQSASPANPQPPPPTTITAILALLFLLLVSPAQTQDLFVDANEKAMNAVSEYTFKAVIFNLAVPNQSILAITFPREYPTPTLHSMAPYSGVVQAPNCTGKCTGITFRFNGTTIFIEGIFNKNLKSTENYYPSIRVFNIKNPPVTNVGSFIMTIFKNTTLLANVVSSQIPTFNAASLAYSVSVGQPMVWATSPLTITLVPDVLIDSIQLLFPKEKWENQTARNVALIPFQNWTCSSSTHSTLICTPVSSMNLSVINLNYYQPGSPLNITINSIYNPSSLANIGKIDVIGKYLGNEVATASITIPSTAFKAEVMRKMAYEIENQSGDKINLTITFWFPQTNNASDVVELGFPPELSDQAASLKPGDYIIAGSNTINFTLSNATQPIRFTPFSIYGITDAFLNITITNLPRPRECKILSPFTIKTYRDGLTLADSSTCCAIPLGNRPTLLSSTPLLSSSSRLTYPVTYILNITTSLINLNKDDQIKIEFPPEFSSQISATNNLTVCHNIKMEGLITSLNPPTCSVTTNTIILSGFLPNNLSAPESFFVNISALTNPSSPPLTGFNMATLSAAGYVLQEIRGVIFNITPTTLTSFIVSASSNTTNQANVVYTFGIGSNTSLAAGYSIKITFPSDFRYINYGSLVCTVGGSVASCGRANSTYTTSTHSILISITSSIDKIGSVTISSVTNPISKATTGAFDALILDPFGNKLQQSSNTSLTNITMTSVGNFPFFIPSTYNSPANGASRPSATTSINKANSRLWMYLSTAIWSPSSKFGLIIQLGRQTEVACINRSCFSAQFDASDCECSYNSGSKQVYVNLTNFTLPSTNYIYLEINNIIIKTTSPLALTAFLSVDGMDALATPSPVAANPLYLQQVSDYSVGLNSTLLSATTDVTINISLSDKTANLTDYFQVYIPLEFGTGSYGTHSVTIANSSFVGSSLTLTGLTNPTTQNYTPFLFIAYDVNNNAIAISTPTNSSKNYSFKSGCSLPCRTCNATSCLSCYSGISWISEVYLSASSNTCVDKCVDGQYLQNNVCKACNPNCKTCLTYGTSYSNGSPTKCLSCVSPELLLNSTCYSTCPTGYYLSSPVCAACMPSCLTCSTRYQCSSCQAPLAFYDQQCLSSCPGGTVYFLNTSDTQTYCVACPADCQLCTSSSTPACLSCSPTYFLSAGSCLSSCPTGLLPNLVNTCVKCQCSSSSCSTTSYNCTSCSDLTSLYQSQCLSQCPSGYFSINNICQTCSLHCSQCTSSTYCILCYLPYSLSFESPTTSLCLTVCPNNTVASISSTNFSYLCQVCAGSCLTCSVQPTHCTSCSSPLLLSNYSCVGVCPSGQFIYNGSCVYCYPDCLSCDPVTPSICLVCAAGYFKVGISCVRNCTGNTFADVITLSCVVCASGCASCENSTNCTSCSNGKYLYNASCYPNCTAINSAFYSYKGTCMTCRSECSSCLPSRISPYACVSCSNPLYYFNPTTFACTLSCMYPYYADFSTRQCLRCASPCASCDTAYNSCLTCQGQLAAYQGKCLSGCPVNFYNQNGVCKECGPNCYLCNAQRCLVCLSFAYLYHSQCVLDCRVKDDLPIAVNNYCTSCSQVPFCQSCSSGADSTYDCFICVYPYVIFNGNCLNECPNFYQPDSNNTCQLTSSYSSYLSSLEQQNKPKLPPFAFLALALFASLLLYITSRKVYPYTYHIGYVLSLLSIVDFSAILYGLYYVYNYYQGDYALHHSRLPIVILVSALGFKVALGVTYIFSVLLCYYFQDRAFDEWRIQNKKAAFVAIYGTGLLGPRFNKLFYSKLWGRDCFGFRIISVQKFYKEDCFNWVVCLCDLVELSAFFLIAYNIFISYAVLYLLPFELLVLKTLSTLCFIADLKKPDRGFFKGDEQLAEQQILEEKLANEAAKRKFQIQQLAKLIRCKSADQLAHQKLYQFLFFDDFRSVYDPRDYEDPPVVPLKKIPKNIERGRFRRGKKISVEEKLRRFAQSLKPEVTPPKDDQYFSKWLYWRPPKKLKKQSQLSHKEPDESMLNLLRDKELLYEEDISKIEVEELQLMSKVRIDQHSPPKRRKKTHMDYDQETIGRYTLYQPSSAELIEAEPEPEEDYFINDLLNRNYAQRQHLPADHSGHDYDDYQLRVLRNSPQKKRERKSRLNELSIQRG